MSPTEHGALCQTQMTKDNDYVSGVVFGNSAHLQLTATSEQVTVDFVRAYLPQDEKPSQQNVQVDYTYQIYSR